MRSTFEETILHKTSVLRKYDVFGFLGRVNLGVSGEILLDLYRFWLGTETENVGRGSIKPSVQSD